MAKCWTQAVIPQSSLRHGTQVFMGRTEYFLPAVLSKCCSLGPCCFLDIPCSCKPPCLCSSCSRDLNSTSAALLQPLLSPLLTLTFPIQLTTQAHLSRLNPMLIFSKTLILIQGEMFSSSSAATRNLKAFMTDWSIAWIILPSLRSPPLRSPCEKNALPCPTALATSLALAVECE